MAPLTPSTKNQIVRTAERLLAQHGLDGVSLRQIGAAAGNANNSAVQYHFGTKKQLIQQIFEYRLPQLHQRRLVMIARARPDDLRSWLECFLVPLLEQGEEPDSWYMTFVATLRQHRRGDLFDRMPDEYRETSDILHERMSALLTHLPVPLRAHRLAHVTTLCIHVGSDRERARAAGEPLLPFAAVALDLIDGMTAYLQTPVPASAAAELETRV